MASRKRNASIYRTSDYTLFARDHDNRVVDLGRRKRLMDSMKKYGFIPSFPIVVAQCSDSGKLIIKDGQHRFETARRLKLPVYYSIETIDFNIAEINNTPKTWGVIDFALLWKSKGLKDYADLIEFQERHGLTITMAIAIMGGHSRSGGAGLHAFREGKFRVRNIEYAEMVAYTYSQLASLTKQVRNNQFQMAISAVCLVKRFDPNRLIRNANKCAERLRACSTRDAYLQDLEDIYNFGVSRKRLVPLKIDAIKELSSRNVVNGKSSS